MELEIFKLVISMQIFTAPFKLGSENFEGRLSIIAMVADSF